MGYQPIPPPRLPVQPDPRLWGDLYVADLQHLMRYRFSWFPSRRRAAHEAVRRMIRWREAHLWPEPETLGMPEPGGLPAPARQ